MKAKKIETQASAFQSDALTFNGKWRRQRPLVSFSFNKAQANEARKRARGLLRVLFISATAERARFHKRQFGWA